MSIIKKLSKTQKEVLDLLTNEFETPKNIAIRRKTSLAAVYKTITILKDKGYISKGFLKGLKKTECTNIQPKDKLLNSRYIRLHGQEWNIKILYKSKYYNELKNKNIIFDKDGNTIRLYNDSIEVYSNESLKFEALDEHRATSQSFNYWQRVFTRLENKLKVILIKPNYSNIKLVKNHYAEVNNEIAKEYNKNKIKLDIYTTDEGKLWFKIDHSWNLHEAETLHKDTAKQDMTNVKRYFNDMRDNKPPLNSELAIHLKETILIQKEAAKRELVYAKHMESHAKFVKEATILLKKINNRQDKGKLDYYF